MQTRSIFLLVSIVLFAACSDDGRGASTSAATAATITTGPGTTGTTEAATAGGSTASGATTDAAPTSGSGGETTSGTTGGSTDAASSGTSSGDASTAGVKLDVGAVPDVGGGGNCSSECASDQAGQLAGDWLLHIEGGNLYQVDVAGGNAVLLCEKIGGANTLTFTRDNRLFATSGITLVQIDPCTCTGTQIGAFGHPQIFGIAPDEGNELFGFSAQANALVRIDTQTGQTTEVGQVGFMFGKHGAAWSEQDQTLYFVTGNTLYTVDIQTGQATEVGPLGVDFGDVGVEQHPATAELYGCTGDGNLYAIDKLTGAASLIGPIGTGGNCTNLGAPWTETEVCLPIPG